MNKKTKPKIKGADAIQKAGTLPFYNNKGDRIYIPENYTIRDLVKMGVREIRIERKGSFLPDGWYSNEKR